MRFCIPNYDICQTDRQDGHKAEIAIAVKKGIPHTCVDPTFSPFSRSNMIGNYDMLLVTVYKSLQRLWSDTDITEVLGSRHNLS
jgi:hypothetical protein